MNFGENLKKLRQQRHISQEELADALHVSRQTISRWESSITSPDLLMLNRICEYFDVDYDEFLEHQTSRKNQRFPLMFIISVIVFAISFFLPESSQDFATSALIITPAGMCLWCGLMGIIFSFFQYYKDHRS